MQPRMIAAAGALMLALASPLPAAAQGAEAPAKTLMEYVVEARTARIAGDHRNWLGAGGQALALAPDHPDLLISVSRANAALGNDAQALALLGQAVQRGAGFDPDRFSEYARLRSDPAFQAVAEQARRNLRPVARAELFATLPAGAEGITFDPVSRRLFVGTEDGALLQIDSGGAVTPFVSGNGLRQILGLKVDPQRRLLWAVTGRFPNLQGGNEGAPEDVGTTGLYAFHLDSGERIAAHDVDERPTLRGFNDMALASDGSIYLTDTVDQSIHVLEPGSSRPRRLVRDTSMSFPNGIVLNPDERLLYVAHVEGISIVDPGSGARTVLVPPADAAFNSIDGLSWHDGALLGVQGSPYLHRIVRIGLAADGRTVTEVATLNSRTPAEYSQTTAAVGGDSLFVVGGAPMPDVYGGGAAVEPRHEIWRIPLRAHQAH